MRDIVAAGPAGDIVQALMDLGATICLPARPQCQQCPLREGCRAFALGTPEAFPAARPRKIRPQRFGVAYWTERDGSLWLVRRPARGLLGGMAALPGDDWLGETSAGHAIRVRHVFTHFALELSIIARAEPAGEGWWQPTDRLDEAGLPTLYRKAVAAVLDQRSKQLPSAA